MFISIAAVAGGAALGALFRFGLGTWFNHVFPTIPMGTLLANLIGGFLMGIFMGLSKNHGYIPEGARLLITTGFLGGLTTFSTFSGETVALLVSKEYIWTAVIIVSHVVGSIVATIVGLYVAKGVL